jgi:hypothetical protein
LQKNSLTSNLELQDVHMRVRMKYYNHLHKLSQKRSPIIRLHSNPPPRLSTNSNFSPLNSPSSFVITNTSGVSYEDQLIASQDRVSTPNSPLIQRKLLSSPHARLPMKTSVFIELDQDHAVVTENKKM